MPAWTPAPYALPYIAANDVLEQTPATNKAQMEKISEYLAHVAGMTPLGTIIPWALPFEAPGDPAYSNVPDLYLPCTGVVYPRTRATELCDAIGHTFVDGSPDVGDVGDYVSGAALNKHHGSGYENTGIYRRTASGFDLVEADGFCTPDFRGRAPFGVASGSGFANGFDGSDHLARAIAIGTRGGDHRLLNHTHNLQGAIVQAGAGQGSIQSGVGVDGGSYSGYVVHAPHRGVDSMDPHVGVNFLIACGVSGSATPSTRSGEVHRLHTVTTDHMIRQRLADPNLSDEEREMLEAQLTG